VFLVQRPRPRGPAGSDVGERGLGDFGAGAAEGARFVSQYQIADPAEALAAGAAKALADARGLALQPGPAASAKAAAGARTVVEVSTVRWGLYGLNLDTFRLLYAARLRVIDASTGAVVTKAECDARDARVPDLRWPGLLTDRAAAVKDELGAIAAQCLAKWASGPLRP
jgi:hypothetical protein